MSLDSLTQPVTTSGPPVRVHTGVPWGTVAALAVGLSFADQFWAVSLREAVGAVQRTGSPFSAWWHEATVLLPAYAVAVLAALTVATRRYGPVLRTRRALGATVLLVVAAGTVVSTAVLVVSAAYDYHLQKQGLAMMSAMRATCTGACLDSQRHATLAAHVTGVLYVSRWLLLTNVVLVGWLVAMWAGRLRLTVTRPARPGRWYSPGRRGLLAGALVGAAAIHAAVTPAHLDEWPAAGTFFLLLTVAELAVAALLMLRLDEPVVLRAAAAVSVGPLVLWLWSRTAGLPFGPGTGAREAVGVADVMACALELAALCVAVALLRASPGGPASPHATEPVRVHAAHARALVVTALVAATVLGVSASGLAPLDAFGVARAGSPGEMTH